MWSDRPVPDRLAAGPTPAPEEAPPEPPADAKLPLVQDAFRWALDLAAARDAGMALTVTEADLTAGHTLAHGLSRLVVAGVDWTLTPDDAAASLEGLLAGHAATGDLAFVAPGTPTNNTGAQRSGFSTAPVRAGRRVGPTRDRRRPGRVDRRRRRTPGGGVGGRRRLRSPPPRAPAAGTIAPSRRSSTPCGRRPVATTCASCSIRWRPTP